MKNLLLLFILSLFLIPIASSQSSLCPDNIFVNGDLENGTPTASHQDIANAVGYSRIWAPGSWADYYTATTGPFSPPAPPSGNYVSCWIANYAGGGTTYREGFKGELNVTLPPNTGTYTLTFDMACLGGWGNSEVAVYALHNPSGGDAPFSPTGAFTPDNMSLFPTGTTFLLNTIPVNASTCISNTKTNQTVIIDTNDPNYPAGGMTHIFITHSDNSSINGARYMGFDNFCLSVSSDCPGSYVSNGDLESGTPTASHQDIDNATDFGRIWATGSWADYYTATTGPFSPPAPPTGNYAGCWIANYAGGGTTYREGFQSKLVATILPNTGSYTLNFDMACLGGWGNSEVAVYGINNPSNTTGLTPTGAFTPSNTALFGAANTILLGTISINNTTCTSNVKVNHSLTFSSSTGGGFPASGMTHFFVTHSDNSGINGARYMGFDNFCLQSAQDTVPCPKITSTKTTCIDDVNGDGVPDYNIEIFVDNPGILNFLTTCGTISPSSLSVPTAGVYNLTVVSNGTCSPFQFEYQSLDANQQDCWREEIFIQLPPCKDDCLCDESFFDAVNLGFNAVLDCPNDVFTPIGLLDCDRVTWSIDGTAIVSTVGNNPFTNPHITGHYEVCMTVTRTQADGKVCQHRFCRQMHSSLVCRMARIGVTPNPASDKLTLTWSTENVPDQISISVFNANGIEVERIDAINGHEGQLQIDIQKLDSGMYFIKAEGAQYAPMPIKFVKKG
ncbi:T9SS type A sorting domain-containing protein [Aureispira sp. CCB-E]|uniref:T9SS type A sorting domain-containing protein n=1 Tax=Aureispira sp. CCB-E TaxID=3051121 RepID=UPI0028685164|nr:T9SS type A sorting domain-containing protein [Aureispira sp. CCB-E]WMX14731.1 T9SS type A sorting domain-containing protein [Aureispira sp. CCB-E]